MVSEYYILSNVILILHIIHSQILIAVKVYLDVQYHLQLIRIQ
jgi:hypothetical protein